MASKQQQLLAGFLFILWFQSRLRLSLVACNPLVFDPTSAAPMLAMPMAAPFLLGAPQMNPYAAASPLQVNPYMFGANPFAATHPMAAAFEQQQQDNNRRSQATVGGSSKQKRPTQGSDSSDQEDKKGLDDLPLSFVSTVIRWHFLRSLECLN